MTAINDSTYRQTKIIATLGPSTSSEKAIEGLIDAGVDVVRLNFSHGNKKDHVDRAKLVRKVCEKKHYHVGIIADLQGPKIRITKFINSKIELKNGYIEASSSNLTGCEINFPGVSVTGTRVTISGSIVASTTFTTPTVQYTCLLYTSDAADE